MDDNVTNNKLVPNLLKLTFFRKINILRIMQ